MSGAQIFNPQGASPGDRGYDRLRQLVHRQPLLFLGSAAVAGILLNSIFNVNRATWLGLTGIVLVTILLVQRFHHRAPMRLLSSLMVAWCLPVGGLWHRVNQDRYASTSILSIASEVATPTILEGVIDTPVVLRRHPLADQSNRRDQSPWQTQITVMVQRRRVGQQTVPTDGRVLVVVDDRRDELRPGDPVRAFGSMRRFGSPTNPGEQDLRGIYRQRRLHARMNVDSADQLVVLSTYPAPVSLINQGWLSLNRIVADIGTRSRNLLLQHTSASTGPLAIALVIGQRDFVDPATRDLLLVTGTAHLLSVSGLHLAIIVVLAGWIATLLRLPTPARICWIIGICLCYTAITGGRPPVLRAAVLVATFMIAIWIRRPSQPLNTLSLAALILIFLNPELVFSIGVQLSFLAVATLVLCAAREETSSPAVTLTIQQEKQLQKLAENSRSFPRLACRYALGMIGQLAWFSGWVTAISLPLVWHHFHVVSPISVITNVLLSPLLFVALTSGVSTVVFGCVSQTLGAVCGSISSVSLIGMRTVIESAASFPYGHVWLPSPPSWWTGAFYLGIVATLFFPNNRQTNALRGGWIGAWIMIAYLLATTPAPLKPGSLEATFVDVGHGTSVVLRFSENDVWLYDCGRLGNDTGSSRDIDATLWSLGVTHLQGILLSHADADHFNALPGVLRRFSVEQIITPPGMLEEPESALIAVRDAIVDAGIEVREASHGDLIETSQHSMQILHPPAKRISGSDNANSLVLRIDCGGKSLILPGDLESPGTAALMDHPRPSPGGVLMAPHHGSLSMDASAVLQWSRPRETVVSGGQRAGRPEVAEMLSKTGSGVHVTNQVGAIRVLIDPNGTLQVDSWSHSPW